jgi:iron complex transport system ATP-binding protein
VQEATYCFSPGVEFLRPTSLSVRAGECWGIIGPNGAGKSTLLRVMAGLMRPSRGRVMLEGQPLEVVPLRQRAKAIGLLPQHLLKETPATVREIVLMGRFPHRSLALFESGEDHRAAEQAMDVTQTTVLADRSLSTLSGGETQRVHLAAALCGKPRILLLDEPTAALDLHHQLAIFEILAGLAGKTGTAVVIVTHDINMAARFCSHVLLMSQGKPVASGSPAEVVRPEHLETVYDVRLSTATVSGQQQAWLVPQALRNAKDSQSRGAS